MAWGESLAGLITDAKEHAHLALRLSPRDMDVWLGEAYLALMQAAFAEEDFEGARKWGRLAIQMETKAPIRQALMIAICGHLGDLKSAKDHENALKEFAPNFISNVLSGALALYRMPEHNALFREGLRKAGLPIRATSR